MSSYQPRCFWNRHALFQARRPAIERFGRFQFHSAARHFQRQRVVALAPFVVFGQLHKGRRAPRIARSGQIGEHRQRRMFAAQLLFERRDIPQGAKQQLIGKIFIDGLPKQRQRVFVLLGLTPPARQAHHLGAVRKLGLARRIETHAARWR